MSAFPNLWEVSRRANKRINALYSYDNNHYREVDFDYRAIAWHEKAWLDNSRVVLLTGSAGGGKSRLAAEKIHNNLKTYPKSTWVMIRKTRESMRNSTVLFYESVIASRDKSIVHLKSDHRFLYEKNNSILVYGGMKDDDQREQIRGIGQDGGIDGAWLEEANRFTRVDFEEVIGRLRGKAAPFQQLLLSTNPDAPMHWINKDLIIGGGAHVYYSSAADNPFNPPDYLETLNMMTGIQRQRLVEGKWVQAEGVIYDNFDIETNVTDPEYNPDQPLIWAVDDGYAHGAGPGSPSYHPRVILICQEDGRGGMNVLAERLSTLEASYEETIDAVLDMGFAPPDIAYVDSSAAMLRGALMVHGIANTGATHPVIEGIRNLRRMIRDGLGQTLLHIHSRCVNVVSEFQMYRYDDTAQVAGDRKPLKVDDHTMDALRYCTFHLRFGE